MARDRRAVAIDDAGEIGHGLEPVTAIVDFLDLDQDDVSRRPGIVNVGMPKYGRVAVSDGTVEEGQGRGDLDRTLFGQLYDTGTEARADDGVRAQLARHLRRRRHQLPHRAFLQAARLDRAVLVEFER